MYPWCSGSFNGRTCHPRKLPGRMQTSLRRFFHCFSGTQWTTGATTLQVLEDKQLLKKGALSCRPRPTPSVILWPPPSYSNGRDWLILLRQVTWWPGVIVQSLSDLLQ
jgi:hypothetical protein